MRPSDPAPIFSDLSCFSGIGLPVTSAMTGAYWDLVRNTSLPVGTFLPFSSFSVCFFSGSWASLPRPRALRALETSARSEEHTSELQSLMRISYAVFCLKKKNNRSRYPTNNPSSPLKQKIQNHYNQYRLNHKHDIDDSNTQSTVKN